MPADVLAGEFSPNMGTPTKELYSMAGLLLIKEFMDWTKTEATEAMRRWVAEKLARTVWNALLKPVGALKSVWNRLRPPQRVAWPDLHLVRPNSGPEPYRLVAWTTTSVGGVVFCEHVTDAFGG